MAFNPVNPIWYNRLTGTKTRQIGSFIKAPNYLDSLGNRTMAPLSGAIYDDYRNEFNPPFVENIPFLSEDQWNQKVLKQGGPPAHEELYFPPRPP